MPPAKLHMCRTWPYGHPERPNAYRESGGSSPGIGAIVAATTAGPASTEPPVVPSRGLRGLPRPRLAAGVSSAKEAPLRLAPAMGGSPGGCEPCKQVQCCKREQEKRAKIRTNQNQSVTCTNVEQKDAAYIGYAQLYD